MFQEEILKVCSEFFPFCRTIDERYRVLSKLGEGRFGKVYLAYDELKQQLVALKLLKTSSFHTKLNGFYNEINTLVSLSRGSENANKVTQIYDFSFNGSCDSQKPVAYYTMNFIELGEFYKLLEGQVVISEEQASFFVSQLLQTVNSVHCKKIYHLDLKPENVLVNGKGELFLCDFGNSLNMKAKPKWNKVNFSGTDKYTPPELFHLEVIKRNKSMWGQFQQFEFEKMDLFAIGVILFIMVFNSFPFQSCEPDDPFFKAFVSNKQLFWQSFQKIRKIS